MLKKKVAIIMGLLLLSFVSFTYAKNVPLTTGEWVPFTSASLDNYGAFTEIVSTVFKEMEMKPEYRFYPWSRCYDSVLKGRAWAAFPYSYTEKRAKEVLYSDAMYCSKTVFIYYEKNKGEKQYKFNKLKDLKKYKIGGVSGYFYESIFKDANVKVDYASKEISCLEKLKLGRIDLCPVNELVGWHLIKTHFPQDVDNFKILAKPLSVDPLHLIVSKSYPNSKELLESFNTVLKRCVEKKLVEIPIYQ